MASPKPTPHVYVQKASRPLPLAMHVVLFVAAYKLARTGKTSIDVAEDGVTGRITTTWDSAAIGALSGPLFAADLATEGGQTQVTYVVQRTDLDEALENGVPMVDLSALLATATADPKSLN